MARLTDITHHDEREHTDMTDKNGQEVTFSAVAISDLPKAQKSTDPATIALGNAILAVASKDSAALDSIAFAERNDAVNRGAVLKRAVRAAGLPDGMRVGARVLTREDGFHVAITLSAKGKGK